MPLLTPQYLFATVTHITPEFLRQQDIRALVLDVDNTLTQHGSQELGPDVAAWLAEMKGAGIGLMLASNNTRARVAPFAEKLGLPYCSFCCKPSPRYLLEAKRLWGLPRRNIAIVGDQIYTDLLAGQLAGVMVLLTRPIAEDPTPSVRMKRRLEAPFLLRYYKRGGRLL